MFIAKVLLFFGAIHVYLWWRLARSTRLPSPWPQIAATLLGLAFFAMLVGYDLVLPLPLAVSRAQLYPVYLWMGAMMVAGALLACSEPIRVLAWVLGRFVPRARSLCGERPRVWLARGLALLALGGTIASVWVAVPAALGEVPVKRLEVTLPRLDPRMNGTTIVQLTDLHLGVSLDRAWLQELVRRVNLLQPDVVAITGDLVDYQPWKLGEEIAPLATLRARSGVYFVTGNHEYYFHVEEWLAELRRLGVHVLHNERVAIWRGGASFDLAGVDDTEGYLVKGHGTDLARALNGRDESRPVVLLAHRPRIVDEAVKHRVDLQLSGHTHGGQFWPWTFLLVRLHRYIRGRSQHGPTTLYVSEGTGFWGPPLRLGTSSEITLVTLRSAR